MLFASFCIGGIMCRGRGAISAVVDGWRSLLRLQHYHGAIWQQYSHGAITVFAFVRPRVLLMLFRQL
jgi:hypothetical protein